MWNDLKLALRSLARRPLFGATVVATLALGIGAATATYAVLRGVVLEALPYPEPSRLLTVAQADANTVQPVTINYATFEDLRDRNRSFARVAAYGDAMATLTREDSARYAYGYRVSRGFFATLGVEPALGREFLPEEDVPDAARTIMLGHGLWQSMFGGDPAIVGKTVDLGGIPRTVVGVLPASFRAELFKAGPNMPDFWVPLRYASTLPQACRTCNHLGMVARLRPEATLESARQDLARLGAELRAEYASDYAPGMGFVAAPAQARVVGNAGATVWLVFGAVLLLLLVVSVNVGNLLLVRAHARRAEFALRMSLGAGAARLRRMLLVETGVLVAIGGVLGVQGARLAVSLLARSGAVDLPRLGEVRIDAAAVGAALGLCAVAAGLASLAPVLGMARVEPARDLRESLRAGLGRGAASARAWSVSLQVALAFALAFGAILIARSYTNLSRAETGFEPEGVTTVSLAPGGARYDDDAAVAALAQRVLEGLRGAPGVVAASTTTRVPMDRNFDRAGFHRRDVPLPGNEAPEIDRVFVSPGYFDVLSVPVVAGRDFAADDRADRPRVALVNETAARLFFAERGPLGARIQHGARDENAPWAEIVGVVGDFRADNLEQPVSPQVFLPQAQLPASPFAVVVRSTLPAADALALAAAAVRTADPGIATFQAGTLEARVGDTLQRRRVALASFAAFALVALMLCGLGVYAVIAQSVAAQTRTIGVQRALGAGDGRVVGWLARQLRTPIAIGLALGVIGAGAWGYALRAQLVGVAPLDPLSYVAVGGALAAVAALAALGPLRRALRVAPAQALRQD